MTNEMVYRSDALYTYVRIRSSQFRLPKMFQAAWVLTQRSWSCADVPAHSWLVFCGYVLLAAAVGVNE